MTIEMEEDANATTDFGSYLRDLRRVRRLTLRAVEEQSGVSNSYLSQVEHGHIRQPSPHVLQKLAAVYGVAYEALMARAGYIRPGAVPPAPAARVAEEPAAYQVPTAPAPKEAPGGPATPGWAFSIPTDLTAEEEVELNDFLQYLKFKRQNRS
jgi:HTH-type transcriptional regulator, competence development regulator